MDSEPPFQETYKILLQNSLNINIRNDHDDPLISTTENCDLPLINLSHLSSDDHIEREKCMQEITRAASTWGFFQVVNHGISLEVIESLEYEQKKLFRQPFQMKILSNFLNLSPNNNYRWGNPKATCPKQLSWSETFHVSITDIPRMNGGKNLRLTVERFANRAFGLAKTLAEILTHNLGADIKPTYFQENCPPSSSYLRLNRYPPCPYSKIFGLIPHTDSDFLSLVYQDQIGGLQLLKDGRWFGVKPNPKALIINIGDLFQALSNGVYKSAKHRVMSSNSGVERFSAAYLYCPSNEATVESYNSRPAIYRKFSFKEYKEQNLKDIQETGDKVGLQRFLL